MATLKQITYIREQYPDAAQALVNELKTKANGGFSTYIMRSRPTQPRRDEMSEEKRSLLAKPEPRDYKAEFEACLAAHRFTNQEFAALLMAAKTMLFERDKTAFLGEAIHFGGRHEKEFCTPRLLHRFRRHDIL
jgi:hypothetical protein